MEGKSNPNRRPSNRQSPNMQNYQFPTHFPQNFPPQMPYLPHINAQNPSFSHPFVTPQMPFFSQNESFSQMPYMSSPFTDHGSGSGTPRRESIDQTGDADEDEGEAGDEFNGEDFYTPMGYEPSLSQRRVRSESQSGEKSAWTTKETETLIKCYMSISSDGVVGTSQKKRSFWARVIAKYEGVRAEDPTDMRDRSGGMLRSKWMRVARCIMKWVSCYDQAVARNRSGQSEDDMMREAQMIHFQTNRSKFTLVSEWKLLEQYPKWQPLVMMSLDKSFPVGRPNTSGSESSGKRARETSDDEFDHILETPPIARPEGIKKAKARLAGKKATDVTDAIQSFNERLKLQNEQNQIDAEDMKKRLAIMAQKEERKRKQAELEERKSNWEMLKELKNNPNREPFEEVMYEKLRNYFTTILDK